MQNHQHYIILGRAETLIYTLGLGAARLLFDYIDAQSLT